MAQEDEDRRAWFRREILPLEPDLLAYARQFCRDGQTDPEDLVHEAFARAIACKTWREIGNPGAFATRILRNCALDALRRRLAAARVVPAELERPVRDRQHRPAAKCRRPLAGSCQTSEAAGRYQRRQTAWQHLLRHQAQSRGLQQRARRRAMSGCASFGRASLCRNPEGRKSSGGCLLVQPDQRSGAGFE